VRLVGAGGVGVAVAAEGAAEADPQARRGVAVLPPETRLRLIAA
jgi:hypothetical protein